MIDLATELDITSLPKFELHDLDPDERGHDGDRAEAAQRVRDRFGQLSGPRRQTRRDDGAGRGQLPTRCGHRLSHRADQARAEIQGGRQESASIPRLAEPFGRASGEPSRGCPPRSTVTSLSAQTGNG